MCVVTGPITIDPELLGETVFLVSGRSSLAGHPGQGNSHFKKGEGEGTTFLSQAFRVYTI